MENELILYLPWPPTVNNYYHHTRRGVFISSKGRAYRAALAEALVQHGYIETLSERLYVEVTLYPPDVRKRDLDNYMKSLLDACTHAGLWEDDSQIDQLEIRRGMKVKSGAVIMGITDAGPVIPWDN